MKGNLLTTCLPIFLALTLFKMGLFGAVHGCGVKKVSLHKICNDETWHTYTFKVQKIYKLRDTPLKFYQHQHFFTVNQQIFLYQKIQIEIMICMTH